jgi:hypothetical protein
MVFSLSTEEKKGEEGVEQGGEEVVGHTRLTEQMLPVLVCRKFLSLSLPPSPSLSVLRLSLLFDALARKEALMLSQCWLSRSLCSLCVCVCVCARARDVCVYVCVCV